MTGAAIAKGRPMPLSLSPLVDAAWSAIDSRIRNVLNDHLREECHCLSPDIMRFKAGPAAGWRASGASYAGTYATGDRVALALTLVWDPAAVGGVGSPVLMVDPGANQSEQQVTSLLERPLSGR